MTPITLEVERLLSLKNVSTAEFDTNDSYYESEFRLEALGVSVPPEMEVLSAQVGWPRVYLDGVEQREDLEGFLLAGQENADDELWAWWQVNNLDVESSLCHLEAMKHGIAYVTIAAPDPTMLDPTMDPDAPIIRVESPRSLYADIDPVTRRVRSAIRVWNDDDNASLISPPDHVTLFLPNATYILSRGRGLGNSAWSLDQTIQHNLGVVPVVPFMNREDLKDRAGHSEITQELRSVTDAASRILMDMQAAAELMAVPQRILFGVAQAALQADPNDARQTLEMYMSKVIAIEDPGTAYQWAAAELQNFVNALTQLAKMAASYTGLPPQYLSQNSDNPASAEAIRAAEARLVKLAERKNRVFGAAWEQVMRIALLVMKKPLTTEHFRMEAQWRDPATPTFAAMAAGVQALVGGPVIPKQQAWVDLGYTEEQRLQMQLWDQESPASQLAALMAKNPPPTTPEVPQAGDDGADPAANA